MTTKSKIANGRTRKSKSVGRPRKNGVAGKGNPSEEVLIVAADLFSSKGYAGTTMAEIADEVGIRGPSLYYHFESKAEIFRAIADTGLVVTTISKSLLKEDSLLSPGAKLYKLILDIVIHLRSSKYALHCLFDPVLKDKEFKDLNKKLRLWQKDLERFIFNGIESDQFEVENIEFAAFTVRGLMGLSLRELSDFKGGTPEQIGKHTADFALRAMCKNKSKWNRIRKEVGVYVPNDSTK